MVVGCQMIDGHKVLTVSDNGWTEVGKQDEIGRYTTRALEGFIRRLRILSEGTDPIVVGQIPSEPRIHNESSSND